MVAAHADRTVIVAHNPLTADIDWDVVQSTLGIKIVPGLHRDGVHYRSARDEIVDSLKRFEENA